MNQKIYTERDNLAIIRTLHGDHDWSEKRARHKMIEFYIHLKINQLQTQKIQRVMVGYRGDDIKYIDNPDAEIQLTAVKQHPPVILKITKPCPEAIRYVLDKEDYTSSDLIIHHCVAYMTDELWAFVIRKNPTKMDQLRRPRKIIQESFVEKVGEEIRKVHAGEWTLRGLKGWKQLIEQHKHKIDPELLKVLDFYML